ncbi:MULTISPECIES: efflux RND transporter periplasmic adaptor subunit [Alphaproteobacteria]|uniref:Secretion protein HylD n=2 Tax=Alphaproteobacteria TaxID=28211 RepID=A0A512HMX8_9HYPH|nr:MULTISPECIES: efflux RND transporter periplasmic adaptor subunit [Alphaproteobacteria]GEO86808.1 secretion protein HylD [Ciceribacter naphthalenivorans]GLR23388.1 secretion protein HylD [Ciceribacter naphthalenivorans]GLT06244.1 secretion protein HylD [Sphingomonas psychrolutea]
MAFWKQLTLSFVAIGAGILLWVWFVPGADGMLRRIGVPESVIARFAPAMQEAAAPGKGSGQAQGGNRRGGGAATLVVVQPVSIATVNDRLSALGTGDAIQSVTVMPQVSGMLSEIAIKSGDRVEKGQVIARLENEEQRIARDQAQVVLKSATEKNQIYTNLKSTVSRIDAFDAAIALEAARLALASAELELKRREIVAPIGGVAGIVTVNPGDNVTTSTAIATLDDRSELLVDFWVPERFAPVIKVGQPLVATAVARPGRLYEGSVAAVDNRIDAASRTLRIRAKIANENDDLRAGMAFTVVMSFDGERYPAVDPLSVQWDSDGSFVWRIIDGKAEKVAVRIIQRNPDAVLVKAALAEGDKVVTEGIQRVRAGRPVEVMGDEAGARGADGEKPVASR